jgi:hypothetical protein
MAFKVSVTVTDSDLEASTFSFYLGAADPDPASSAQSIVEAADVLFDGIVTAVGITEEIDFSGWAVKVAQTAENDRLVGGRFIWGAGAARTTLTLPTFDKATYVPAGSENIDVAHLDVAAFITAFLAELTTTNQETEITVQEQAYEVHGGKR